MGDLPQNPEKQKRDVFLSRTFGELPFPIVLSSNILHVTQQTPPHAYTLGHEHVGRVKRKFASLPGDGVRKIKYFSSGHTEN